MILTKEQSIKRLNSSDNIINKESIRSEEKSFEVEIKDGKNKVGRPGSHNLSDSEKVAIGVLANTVGNDVAAELMGVSENTARHLRTGQTTLSHGQGTQRYGEDQELRNKIEERIESTKLTIHERAAEKLLLSLGALDQEKISNCSAKEAAQIANQMSQVVRNISNNGSRDGGNKDGSKVKIIMHQPKSSREESFDVIEIGVD